MDDAARTDLADLVDAVPLDAGGKREACDRLRGEDRFYHGIEHVALLWRRHRAFAREAGFDGRRESRLIASAILFHDCIYTAGRQDNETLSAQAWLDASAAGDLEDGERAWVAATILATRDHLGYAAGVGGRPDRLEALRLHMLDLDLTPLGEAPRLFDRNAELLRVEAAHLDDAAFETARLRMLRRFTAAPAIYRTPALAARFEAQARDNLARHLAEVSTVTDRPRP